MVDIILNKSGIQSAIHYHTLFLHMYTETDVFVQEHIPIKIWVFP